MDPRRLLTPTFTLAAGLLMAGCAVLPGLNDEGLPSGAAPESAVAAPQVLDAVAEEAAPVESATAVPYLSAASRAPAEDRPPPAPAPTPTGRAAIARANQAARAPSRADGFVGGVQVFAWSPGRVFEIWTAPLRVTTLTLGEGETLVSKAAGDTVRWQIGEVASGMGPARRTHVLLKPLERGLETNLVLTTNRRVYLLDLKSGAADAFNAAVAWDEVEPAGPVAGPEAEVEDQKGPDPLVTPQGPLDARYRIEPRGLRARWTPSSVFNDGLRTFIAFDADLQVDEAPVLFVLAPDGEAQMVNYRQQGGLFVVDRLFDRAELRLGDRRPQVVRRSGPDTSGLSATEGPLPKEPAPGLSLRAPRPPVIRLRRSVVQVMVMGGVVLVGGSLAWAFVVQPELRANAQERVAEKRPDAGRGVVRPTELVTRQPSSYDRLPEPRGGAAPEATDPPPAATPVSAYPVQAYRPPPAPRSMAVTSADQAARSGLFFDQVGGRSPPEVQTASTAYGPGEGAVASQGRGEAYNRHALTAPLSPFELKAGAVVPAALLTGVDTARAGPVVAMVTQNIFDTVSGRHLLIPQGTRLIGRHEGESAYGDRRAFLVWDRLILPNGKSLILGGEPGVDTQGAVGVRGQVDRRLFPLLVGTLFAGAITTLGQVARDDGDRGAGGWLGDAGDAAAIEGAQVGGRLVDRELEVRPSIRLRPGASVRVMITRDLILEPYRP